MGTASANSIFWSFCQYVTHNGYKVGSGMTVTDLNNMRDLFIAANAELSTTATYTDAEFPGGITVSSTTIQAAADQANYPEKHPGH
jgi:hypothetical protein